MGFTTSNWQIVWAALNLANVFASLVMGYVGDKIGRIRTTAWIGGLGCAITVFAMYYGSVLFGTNMLAAIVPAMLFGITLGAYVPLSAIVPTLAPDQKGSAVAILNLGAGLSNFAGPLVVTLFLGSVASPAWSGSSWGSTSCRSCSPSSCVPARSRRRLKALPHSRAVTSRFPGRWGPLR
ncbi:MFS transporter [Propionibacterium freudenreichii]|uniref:MFS transporter n=1 Tax=Propionibacterium freudenreichii TaxID=1744 RepID=UPI00255065DA|nr:MFS transporter [Propionibacterium freudenreichii]